MSEVRYTPELVEFALAVERWAHGEGIVLSPTLKMRIEAIRAAAPKGEAA